MPLLSIPQYRQLEALLAANLPARVAALEAGLASERPAEAALAPRERQRAVAGAPLREVIRQILAASGPSRMTGKAVRAELERSAFTPLPSSRTVRWHMAALRVRRSGNSGNE